MSNKINVGPVPRTGINTSIPTNVAEVFRPPQYQVKEVKKKSKIREGNTFINSVLEISGFYSDNLEALQYK